MDTLKNFYTVGRGPSSSHTIGPERASLIFEEKNKGASHFIVELYGSLAATGRGHFTGEAIENAFAPKKIDILWKPEITLDFHTNGMKFFAYDNNDTLLDEWLVFSVGGGTIMEENQDRNAKGIYPFDKMTDIIKWCEENNASLWDFITKYESEDLYSYLVEVSVVMKEAVERGLKRDGILPGSFEYPRKAKAMLEKVLNQSDEHLRRAGLIYSYALAVSEENASSGTVVTAPTCGAAGLVPGLLYFFVSEMNLSEEQVVKGLAIAGLIGNLIKHNASISGAEAGCQAEVGSACAMGAAMSTFFLGGDIKQIEYAAEISLEHHLGLTCDPVDGYVLVPCIERNAIGAIRSIDSAYYALLTDGIHSVNLDKVILTMGITGKDLKKEYRETSLGGLAKFYFDAEC